MKRLSLFLLVLSIGCIQLFAQGTLQIQNGTYLVASGTPEIVLQNVSWKNNGTFTADSSTVNFNGTSSDTIAGSAVTNFYGLKINNTQDTVYLEKAISVTDSIYFIAGILNLNGNDITLGTDQGGLSGESETARITGANGGEIVKVLPLNAPSGTNPGNLGVSITSASNLSSTIVRRGHVAQDLSGSNSIERYYVIVPANNAGLNASVEVSYFDAELNGLTEADLESWHQTGTNWINYEPDMTDAVANTVDITLDTLGTFTLGEGALKLSPKVFLQGAYSSGTMNDNLRQANVLPTTEPYTGLGYTQVTGGGETIGAEVLAATGNDAIVDWIFLELRSKADSSVVVRTQSALLQRDGDIVGLDGVSPVNFSGLAQDEYFLQVKHRNHLGVRTPSAITFSRIGTTYDFSSALGQAWDNITLTSNDAMVDLSGNGTVYGLFLGDVSQDGQINVTDLQGTANLITPNQSGVYSTGDLSFDGNLNVADLQTSGNVVTPNKIGHVVQ